MTSDGTDNTWVGARLLALRKKKGLTQEQLAEKTGLSRETVNKLERSKRALSPYYAAKLAPALGIKPTELQRPTVAVLPPEDPLALLRRLSATVGEHHETLDALNARVEELERAAAKPRRGRGEG